MADNILNEMEDVIAQQSKDATNNQLVFEQLAQALSSEKRLPKIKKRRYNGRKYQRDRRNSGR